MTEEIKPSTPLTPVKPTRAKKPKHFLNNRDLLNEVILSKQRLVDNPSLGYGGAMTRNLTRMFILLVDKFASKNNWSQYSYIEELKGQALVNLCDKWHMFDPNRNPEYPNPFAFYTAVVQNSFRGQILKEKKPQKIKDALLVSMGLTPSYGAQLDGEDSSDYYAYQREKSTDDSSNNGPAE